MYKLHVFTHKYEYMSCINCIQLVFPSTLALTWYCISSDRKLLSQSFADLQLFVPMDANSSIYHSSSFIIYASFPFIQYPIAQECNLHQYATPDSTPLHRIPSAGAENTLAGGKLSNIEELHNMHY